MEYVEVEQAFEEFIGQDEFKELRDNLSGSGRANPMIQYMEERAIFYLQVEDSLSDEEYSRVALAEYREGEEYPVPFSEDELENMLDGTGEVTIDDSLVDQREINYPEQREMTS